MDPVYVLLLDAQLGLFYYSSFALPPDYIRGQRAT